MILLGCIGVVYLFILCLILMDKRKSPDLRYRIIYTKKGYWIEWSDGTKEFHEDKHVIDDIISQREQQQ